MEYGGLNTDDRRCAAILQSADGGQPFPVPHVDDDVVSLVEQRIGGGQAETVGRTGDQDSSHTSRTLAPGRNNAWGVWAAS